MSENNNQVPMEEKKPKKRRSGLLRVFGVSLVLILIFVAGSTVAVYQLGHQMYTQVNYVADEEVQVVETLPEEIQEIQEEETVSSEDSEGVAVDADALSSIHALMAAVAEKNPVQESSDEVLNILLIGVDRRDKSWNGNSDSMILLSIDKGRNRVQITSLMRDTYVDIPGVGYRKLNAAYAHGGGPLLCETITNTFKIPVDRYAAVDFFDLIHIIDAIGGVTLEVSDKEAEVANGYILDMCNLMDEDPEGHLFDGGGVYYCDGLQAVGFARNRYVGNSDFSRTERQRYVIQQLIAEARQMNLAQITEKMTTVLQYVTMNIKETDIWDLVKEVPELLSYKFETSRIPYDNMYATIYVKGQDMLVPYWEDTIAMLQESIYGGASEE